MFVVNKATQVTLNKGTRNDGKPPFFDMLVVGA
jgi:hypothetical protein